MQVVWFKRDLRVANHSPLAKAAKSGQCLRLYGYEPELIHSDEFDTSHLQFINESLRQLDLQLRNIGGKLSLRIGRMPDVLDELHREHGIDALWSHEETGNKGFPVTGELEMGSDAENNRAYIPSKGSYAFEVDLRSFAYSLQLTAYSLQLTACRPQTADAEPGAGSTQE